MMTTDGGRSPGTGIVRQSNKKVTLSNSNNSNHVETRRESLLAVSFSFDVTNLLRITFAVHLIIIAI